MESGVTKEVWQWKDNTQKCEILFIDLRNIFPDDTAHGADRGHFLFLKIDHGHLIKIFFI